MNALLTLVASPSHTNNHELNGCHGSEKHAWYPSHPWFLEVLAVREIPGSRYLFAKSPCFTRIPHRENFQRIISHFYKRGTALNVKLANLSSLIGSPPFVAGILESWHFLI